MTLGRISGEFGSGIRNDDVVVVADVVFVVVGRGVTV